MKRILVAAVVLIAVGAGAPSALADACGIPDTTPFWVDFGGHDAPIQARPGLVIAVASGTDVPAQIRAAGAATVMFDLNLNKRVGTTTNPADPSVLEARAKSLYDYAVSVTGCQTPMIAENELAGAQTPTPWSSNNAQYRANVLQFLTALAALGARPLLSIANPPYTARGRRLWWQQVSKVAILLRQVYFTKPNAVGLYGLGPVAASRAMRQSLRGLVNHLTQVGIPSGRVALQMQFTSSPGLGTRAGLQPASSWLEIVKLEALAAKSVAQEFRSNGVWSWGWATFNPSVAPDPDKPAAACVWLWARDQSLCDGPAAAGEGFDASLTEGQLDVPAGARCIAGAATAATTGTSDATAVLIDRNSVSRFTKLTGDPGYAASVLLEQATLKAELAVNPRDVESAQRAVVAASFGGDLAKYRAAVVASKLTLADAQTIIATRLRRDEIEARFKPPTPTGEQIDDFIATYTDQQVRLVSSTRAAPWLGGAFRGWAVATLAPSEVFGLTAPGKIDTPDGTFDVTPVGAALPLGLLPRAQAVDVASVALGRLARERSYRSWLHGAEQKLLADASCLNDQIPTAEATDLSPFVPFLLPV